MYTSPQMCADCFQCHLGIILSFIVNPFNLIRVESGYYSRISGHGVGIHASTSQVSKLLHFYLHFFRTMLKCCKLAPMAAKGITL